MANNNWNHAAWVYDGSSLKFYLNGVLTKSDAVSGKNAIIIKSCVGKWANRLSAAPLTLDVHHISNENNYIPYKH